MPINPMQRRARNSFLGGFFVALLIMAVVVLLLLNRIKALNDAKEAVESLQVDMYVASTDLESGAKVTMDSFTLEKVQTTIDSSLVVSEIDFQYTDEEGNPKVEYDENGNEKIKEMVMKIDVPAGTIVTKEMITESDQITNDDHRIQEYNMILLPSQLKAGDYIDIRLSLPKGQDYIVLAKKQVLETTETGIWLKLSEEEILTLGNAIVESYIITGSKLYAIEYTEPGMQKAAQLTYPVSAEVLSIINTNPNILQEAKSALWDRYNANEQAQAVQRNNYITPEVQANADSISSNVESKNQEENDKIKANRANYLTALDGGEEELEEE